MRVFSTKRRFSGFITGMGVWQIWPRTAFESSLRFLLWEAQKIRSNDCVIASLEVRARKSPRLTNVLDTNLAWLDEDKLSAPHFSALAQSLLNAAW